MGNDNEIRSFSENRPSLMAGEYILWNGKPEKWPFLAEKILTMMPIAILWICFDSNLFRSMMQAKEMRLFMVLFFIAHMTPVWIWIGSMISASRVWRNTHYYVTNRRIIIQSGFFAVNENSIFFKDIHTVQKRIGIFDKVFGTGTILFNSEMYTNKNTKQQLPSFRFMKDAEQLYLRVHRTVLDIQTDMEYPNAFRPAENPGYGTNYDR